MKIYLRLLKYVYPYRFTLVLAALSMVLVSATTSGSAYIIKPVMDNIFVNKRKEMIIPFAVAIASLYFLKGLFRFFQGYLMGKVGMRVVTDLRKELFDHLLAQDMTFFVNESSGNLLSRIVNDVFMVQNAVTNAITGLLQHFLTVLGLLGVVFYMNYKLAFFAVIVFPVAIYPFIIFSKKIRGYSRETQQIYSSMSNAILEGLKAINIVKAFNTESYEKEKFKKENETLNDIAVKNIKVQSLSSPVMEFIGALGVAIIISVGGYIVIKGDMTQGDFFAFIAALLMLYDPIKKMSGVNSIIQLGIASGERIFQILDIEPVDVDSPEAIEMPEFKKEIKYESIYFRYEKKDIIKNVSMTIKKGEMIAIVGSTGSGKTTLVNLLPRFYGVSQGAITIDNIDINKFTLGSLRRNISVVTQQTLLFNDTVMNNILYGNWERSMEDAVEAAKIANAHDFILSLEKKYDTIIGESGVKLSGGEKQRISIARAVLKNAPILILDEATSSLDTESERQVQEALERLMSDRTTIVIAHRLSTVRKADRIYVLRAGEITEVGSHEELLGKNGEYYRLYTMQFTRQERESIINGV